MPLRNDIREALAGPDFQPEAQEHKKAAGFDAGG